MAEIINLNHFRKAKQKAEKKSQAARNRVRHGRRKDDRVRLEMEEERRRQDLDGRNIRDRLQDDPQGEDEPA